MLAYVMCGPRAVSLGSQAAGPKGIPSDRLQHTDQDDASSWVHDPVLLSEGGQTSR